MFSLLFLSLPFSSHIYTHHIHTNTIDILFIFAHTDSYSELFTPNTLTTIHTNTKDSHNYTHSQ